MLRRHQTSLMLVLILVWPLPAFAGWGGQLGGWLTNLPVVDAIGERILDNRIAFVPGGGAPKRMMRGRIRSDLGSRANIRNIPATGQGSQVIDQLNPGDSFIILRQEPGIPWYSIRLQSGAQGFIHQNLVVVTR